MRHLAAVAVLVLAVSPAHAAQMQCWSVDFERQVEYIYSIDASRDRVAVTSEFKQGDKGKTAAEILNFWHASKEGPLYATSIYLILPDMGTPAQLVVDWTTNSMAFAYIPYLAAPGNLLVARDDYECRRLD